MKDYNLYRRLIFTVFISFINPVTLINTVTYLFSGEAYMGTSEGYEVNSGNAYKVFFEPLFVAFVINFILFAVLLKIKKRSYYFLSYVFSFVVYLVYLGAQI